MLWNYSVAKNQALINATMWGNLKNLPSERTQTQKITYYMILFM